MAHPDVIEARVTGDLEFSVRFSDGIEGRVRFRDSHLHGVFEPLKDARFFARMTVTDGFVSWPDEIDLAPDAMYDAIRRDGEWILE